MAYYRKSCPHCGCTIEAGGNLPTKHLGNPVRVCKWCHKTYLDRDIVDWGTASIFKKISYCLANGRFYICLVPYIIAAAFFNLKLNWLPYLSFLAGIPIFLIMFALCIVYVHFKVKSFYNKK